MNLARFYFKFITIVLTISVFLFVLTIGNLIPKSNAVAGINRTINFQGKLVNNPLKTNVSNTSYTVVFTVYDRATGGTALWTETQTVNTADGIFRVSLGSVTPFPANFNFNWDGLYLGMKVNADAEMTPRIQLTAVPFAFNAEKVAGLTVQDDAGNASTSATLRIANSKTITITNGLTFSGIDGTTITFQGTDTYVGKATTDVLTNKSIGSTGLTFSGATTDITTGTNEDLIIDPNGIGRIGFNTANPLAGVDIRSSFNTLAVASISGSTPFAALVVDNSGLGDLFTASTSGMTKFSISNDGTLTGFNSNWNIQATGSAKMTAWEGGGLSDNCDSATDKIIWNSSTKQFECGVDMLGEVQTPDTRTFIDTTAVAFADNDTTELFNDTPRPNIDVDSSTTPILVAVQIRGNASNTTADAFLAARVVYTTDGSAPSCTTSTQAGQAMIGGFTTNTTHPWQVVGTFVHVPGTGGNIRYTVCTSSIATGTATDTPEAVEISLTELGSASSNWTLTNGSYAQKITTADVLLGGSSTESAAFRVVGQGNPFKGTLVAASVSANTSFAALVSNNNGVGDLFTASKSGATKFTVLNNGNIQFAGTTNFLTTLASGATLDRVLTIPNSGAVDTFCLQTAANCGSGGGVNLWQQASGGVLAPGNLTQDILFGSTATSSAKFAVLNMSGSSNPTASVSAQNVNNNAVYIDSTGFIQGVRNQTLTLGGSTTGNIAISPNNGGAGSVLNFNTITANFSGTTTINALNLNAITTAATLALNGATTINSNASTLVLNAGGTVDIQDALNVDSFTADTGNVAITLGDLILGGNTRISNTGVGTFITGTTIGSQTFTTNNISDSGALTIGTGVNGNLTLTPNGTGATILSSDFDSGVKIGSSANPAAALSVSGGIGNNAAFILNNNNSGDLFTASASGTTKFTISNSGAFGIAGDFGSLGECLKSGGDSASIVTWGTCGSTGAAGTWTLDSTIGAHYPINNTADLLIGGISTSAAKFKITGLNNALSNLSVGIGGMTSPTGLLNVEGAYTGKALSIFNQLGNQDIFAASASGTPKFAIGVNGEIKVGSGLLSAGINGQCLVSAGSGAAVGWGSCATGGSAQWWQLNSALGTLTTGNQTLDVLFSANNGATSSAKVAFINLNGTATPVASISATSGSDATKGIYLSGNGSIQSVRKNTLTLGGSTTGAIQFNPGGISNPNLFLNSNGDVGVNTSTPLASFDLRANVVNFGGTKAVASVSGQTSFAALVANNSGVGDIFTASKGGETKFVITNSGNVGIGTANPTDKLDVNGNIVIEKQTTSAVADMQRWSKITGTAGTIGGNNSSITGITASAVYNGSLYIGTSKSNGAEVYRYDGNSTWTKVTNTTAGTIATGGTPTANIDTISSMIVYNGYLYIGTTESNSAEVYRYDGSTTWTKVTQATAGTIRSGGTASIDGVSSMAVHGGKLYIGTSESAAAQIYRYEGGTSWMLQNGTAGTFVTTNTAAVNTITSMVSFQGSLYFTTAKTGDADFVRMNGNGAFLAMNAAGTTGSYQVYNTEGTVTGAAVTAFNNATLSVYAGKIVLGMYKSNAAEVFQWNPNETASTSNIFIRLNSAAGTIRTGGTASIDAVSSITTYGGRLYIGTSESGSGQLYRYDGTAGSWTVVSQNTAGTISSGGTAAIDTISSLIPYGNNQLFAGIEDATSLAEGYTYSVSIDQSYALQFHVSNSQAGGEQGTNYNLASIYFVASLSANLNNKQGNTGAFVFSHNLITNNGSYDVAEDYPTRDETLEPGDVVSIDTNERVFVKKSEGEYDYTAIGVYSESPAMRLSQDTSSINGGRVIPVALAGRVPVKVTAENGEIKKGDPLTPSSIPGVAMKAKKSGIIIGQAMEDYDSEGIGKITIYVKSTTYNGSIAENFVGVDLASSDAGQKILDQILNDSSPGLSGSNIVTDRLVSTIEIVTPKMTVDTLVANNIQAAHIEGLDLINDRLTSLEAQVATIGANFVNEKSIPVYVEYASISASLTENERKIDQQNKLMKLISDQIASSSSDYARVSSSASANISNSSVLDSFRVKGNGLVEGVLNVVDSLITNNLIANGLSTFLGDVVFKSKANFEDTVTFSNDIGGTATIQKNDDRVEVKYEKEFSQTPLLNATVTFDQIKDEKGNLRSSDDLREEFFLNNYSYVIADKSNKGFSIFLNKKANSDINFTWTAIRVKDAKNIQSRLTSP